MAEVVSNILNTSTALSSFSQDRETFPLQGRFIVHPRNVKNEQIHEVFIDQHGLRLDQDNFQEIERGSFVSVASSLQGLREQGS